MAYRSSEQLRKQDARLSYDSAIKALLIDRFDGQDPLKVELALVGSQKARDYVCGNGLSTSLVLIVGAVQHSFVFDSRRERDFWEHQISNMTRTMLSAGGASSAVPGGGYWSVRRVDILDPTKAANRGVAVTLRMDLTCAGQPDKLGVDLALREGTSHQACKEQVVQFAKEHGLLPTESTSIYRLAKALMKRHDVKHETEALIRDISLLHVEELARSGRPEPDYEVLVRDANERLAELAHHVPQRIGDTGAGAQLLGLLLTRNIEKLRVINEMTKKIRSDAAERQSRSREGSPRRSPRSPRASLPA